ncbi:MAG: NTP transferase domain-containing protein [bacterium]
MHNQKRIISATVLAAGSSTRMGDANKLLLQIDNKPVVAHTIESLLQGGVDEIIAVLGHEQERLRKVLPDGIKIAVNADYRQGMASSVRCGVQNLDPASAAVFIVLADMPFISSETIQAMTRIFRSAAQSAIVVPYFQGRQGNPVLFDSHFFSELRELEGDRGAKSILHKYSRKIIRFDCDDPAILIDMDTPDAFDKLKRRES